MKTVMKHRKQFITMILVLIMIIVGLGIYILNTTLSNLNYSRNQAHAIVLEKFPGTITESTMEYENLEILYDLTVVNQNNQTIEVVISAKTGNIVEYEYKE